MSEMVERVARAIAFMRGGRIVGPGKSRASREIGWKSDGAYLEEYAERHWREHEQEARAAIAACEAVQAELGAVTGELWLWRNGDHYLAYRHEFPCDDNGDPLTLGEPVGKAIIRDSRGRRTAADDPQQKGAAEAAPAAGR